jgi:hypothetical protein
MSTYIKNSERSQIKGLVIHLKLLEKQEQDKHKTSRRRGMIKIGAKINEIKTEKIQRINKTKSWLFERTKRSIKPWQIRLK